MFVNDTFNELGDGREYIGAVNHGSMVCGEETESLSV